MTDLNVARALSGSDPAPKPQHFQLKLFTCHSQRFAAGAVRAPGTTQKTLEGINA